MSFLKFFDDDSHLVGLCGFKMLEPHYSTSPIKVTSIGPSFTDDDCFFNLFQNERIFETNFSKNALL